MQFLHKVVINTIMSCGTDNYPCFGIQTWVSIPNICEPLTGQAFTYATSLLPYFAALDLADPGDVKGSLEVGVLIGVDLNFLLSTFWCM